MVKIGLIVGMEEDFPRAFLERVHKYPGVEAEIARVGGVREQGERDYDVLIDRLSHDVPYYRYYLKSAALRGTYCINDPFWWSADDKFFGYSLAARVGVAVPRTVMLPSRDYIPAVDKERSLRNLEFPLDWQSIVSYIGFPAVLKPADGGGWRHVSMVRNMEELLFEYNKSGTLTMTLQEYIDFEQYVRCVCIGRETILPIEYEPPHRRYVRSGKFLSPALERRVIEDAYKLNVALGYDMNSVEFAIKDGVPYAIDFTNPAPDMYQWSLGDPYFDIAIDEMLRFSVKVALNPPKRNVSLHAMDSHHAYLWQAREMSNLVVPAYDWVGGDEPGRRTVRRSSLE